MQVCNYLHSPIPKNGIIQKKKKLKTKNGDGPANVGPAGWTALPKVWWWLEIEAKVGVINYTPTPTLVLWFSYVLHMQFCSFYQNAFFCLFLLQKYCRDNFMNICYGWKWNLDGISPCNLYNLTILDLQNGFEFIDIFILIFF